MASRLRAARRPPTAARPRGRAGVGSLVVLAAFAVGWLVVAVIRGVPAWAGWLVGGASALAFVLYAADKAAAVHGRDRISESTLLAIGLVGGWPGAVIAQQAFRHKTSKRSFRVRFWASVAVNVAAFAGVAAAMLPTSR